MCNKPTDLEILETSQCIRLEIKRFDLKAVPSSPLQTIFLSFRLTVIRGLSTKV